MIKKILTINNSLNSLVMPSLPVNIPFGKKIYNIAKELIEVLEDKNGGAGIAAPQIGYNKRIMLCSYDRKLSNAEIIINPNYYPINNLDIIAWEGCYSIPLTFAKVKRWKEIEVSYFNLQGNKINKILEGVSAQIFQHEYDHLEGRLITDNASEQKHFTNLLDYKKFLAALHINYAIS